MTTYFPRPLMLLLLPAALSAQPDLQALRAGDEVKVRADGAIGRFRVVEWRDGAILLQGRYDDTTRLIPVAAIRRIAISRGPYTRTQGAGRGFVRGATVGSLLGPFMMGTPGSSPAPSPVEQAVSGAVIGAMLGGIVGGAIGTLVPGTNWERLPLVAPRVDGRGSAGLAIGVALRF